MDEQSTDEVGQDDIYRLLEAFAKTSYSVKCDQKTDIVTERCLRLLKKDYQITVINNLNGELCAHYPSKIAVLEFEKSGSKKERVQSMFGDAEKIKESFKQSRFARCRTRFVVPVVLYDGKHICRSATLSSGPEMYTRSSVDVLFSSFEQTFTPITRSSLSDNRQMQLFDRYRGQDINVLKLFDVKYIVDLMVEKKKVKFGMNVTSSEKVDKLNRYGEFCIVSIPYPGCEFFKEWKDNCYLGETVSFDWNQSYVDACLDIPPTEILNRLSIDWSIYRNWNLIEITQNYLKMILHVLKEGDKGVLVHCISGWDRTPMFVSLIRLSLWADGVIHKHLSAVEMVYLTLAYDWYLFGHNLSDRLTKGEEILLFCFNFLPHISTEEYSVRKNPCTNNVHSSSQPEVASPHGQQTLHGSWVDANEQRHQCDSSNGSGVCDPVLVNNISGFAERNCSCPILSIGSDHQHGSLACSSDGGDSQSENLYSVTGNNSFQHSITYKRSSSSPVQVPGSSQQQPTVHDIGSWQLVFQPGNHMTDSSSYSAHSSSNIAVPVKQGGSSSPRGCWWFQSRGRSSLSAHSSVAINKRMKDLLLLGHRPINRSQPSHMCKGEPLGNKIQGH